MTPDSSNKIKQTIASSHFAVPLKERLVSILPSLDKQTLNGLVQEVGRADSAFVAEKITSLWERFGRILGGLRQRSPEAKADFFQLLGQTEDFLNDEQKIYVLNLVVDARHAAERNSGFFAEAEIQRMIEFEMSLLRYLPQDEIGFFLERCLLPSLARIDVFRELKIAVSDGEWLQDSPVFKTFSDALARNQEILISAAHKSVSDMIREFISFGSAPLSQRTTLDVTQFLVKNSSVGSLKGEEKFKLSTVLNIFLWILHPKIDMNELVAYKQEMEGKKLKFYEALYAMSTSGQETNAPKYLWQLVGHETIPSLAPATAVTQAPSAPRAPERVVAEASPAFSAPRVLPPPPFPPVPSPVIQPIVRQTYTVPPKFTTPFQGDRVATSPLPQSSGVSSGKPIPVSQQSVTPPRVEPQKPVSMPEIKIVEIEVPQIIEPPKTAPSPTTIFRMPSTPASQPRPQIPRLREQPKAVKPQEPAKPEPRPDLIKPAISDQRSAMSGLKSSSPVANRPSPIAPAAPHPTAVDRSHITVAPKLAGAPTGPMVRPVAQAMSNEPASPSQGGRPATGAPSVASPIANRQSQGERSSSTLDELRKIHAEEEKRKQELGTQGAVPRIMSLGASDFSVNEALIHAGRSKPGAGSASGGVGGTVAEGEPPDVAEKLKKLESNFADKPKDKGVT